MTTPDHYERVRRLFAAVCELEPPQRGRVLGVLCEDQPALRLEVERLLERDHDPESFLGRPALGPDFRLESDAERSLTERSLLGARIAGYEIQRLIGAGGMGAVYEAVQERPHRKVALKVLRRGLASGSALKRFEHEAQVLGRLHHPGIAQIFEAGTFRLEVDGSTSELPYFAMELIPDARPLTEYVRAKKPRTRERLELFARICDAVHHGHQKGVIHRDLKPANILIDASGQPKVIDFGVARATDRDVAITTIRTDVGQLIGTLQYMSPEQCAADPDDVDIRSDVYALGVVLYEVLCGRPPYAIAKLAVHEALRVIREETPTRPSTVVRALRGDVETITLKALEKERERRYPSAAELAQDLRRYLSDEPIAARPASATYRLTKFARRHRALVAGVAATFLALVGGIVATSIQTVKATKARHDAEMLALTEKELRATAELEKSRADLARTQAEEKEREARRQAAIAEDVNKFLNEDLLGAIDPEFARGREVTVREVVERAAERIEGRFEKEPLVEAGVHATLGRVFHKLGRYEEAETHVRRLVELTRAALGEDDPDTLDALDLLGSVLQSRSRYDEAERLLLDVLERRRRLLGAEDVATLYTVHHLANTYVAQGRFREAEELLTPLRERVVRDLGPDHELTISVQQSVASLLAEKNELEAAVDIKRQVLDALRRKHGPDDPRTFNAANNLGGTLAGLHEYEEAEAILRDLAPSMTRVLGADHEHTLNARNSHAWVLLESGRFAEALPHYERLVEQMHGLHGDDHDLTIVCRSNLGACYVGVGRFAEALAQLERALECSQRVLPGHWLEGGHRTRRGEALAGLGRHVEAEADLRAGRGIMEQQFGRSDQRWWRSTRTLVRFLVERGRFADAAAEYGALLEVQLETFSEDHWDPQQTMKDLAGVLRELDRLPEAEELVLRVLNRQRVVLGEDDPLTRRTMLDLAFQYVAQSRLDEAIALYRKLLAATAGVDGEDHEHTMVVRAHLGATLQLTGGNEEAVELLEVATSQWRKSLGAGPQLGIFLGQLGKALLELDLFEDAEAALLDAHEMLEAGRGARDRVTLEIVQALVTLYQRWERPDLEAEWKARLAPVERGGSA